MGSEVTTTIEALSSYLRGNPKSAIPGLDARIVADWLDTIYYEESSGTLIFNGEGHSREEIEMLMTFREAGLSPETVMKCKGILKDLSDHGIDPEEARKNIANAMLMRSKSQ